MTVTERNAYEKERKCRRQNGILKRKKMQELRKK